jgi:protein NirF
VKNKNPILIATLLLCACAPLSALRGTGDLGLVVERASGSVMLIDTSTRSSYASVSGLGDLSHATAVYSRDGRYAYVFGRDGGLTKVDMLRARIAARVVQSGNSIGGAISQDGRVIAVANYTPGGVRLFDSATLAPLADIPASYGDGTRRSKVVGIADVPGERFIFSLYDAGEIWIADCADPRHPVLTKFRDVGRLPYDGLITRDGRWYIAGLFGEDGLALLDLWHPEKGVRRILDHYGRGQQRLPVYKMPHLRGWAVAGRLAVLPAVGHHEVLIVDTENWKEVGRIALHGQPVFAIAQPGGRRVWVNFAFPDNDTVQVIDLPSRRVVKTLKPGRAVLHMEFTPRGEQVWISSRDDDVVRVYDPESFRELAQLKVHRPSGILLSARAFATGF